MGGWKAKLWNDIADGKKFILFSGPSGDCAENHQDYKRPEDFPKVAGRTFLRLSALCARSLADVRNAGAGNG